MMGFGYGQTNAIMAGTGMPAVQPRQPSVYDHLARSAEQIGRILSQLDLVDGAVSGPIPPPNAKIAVDQPGPRCLLTLAAQIANDTQAIVARLDGVIPQLGDIREPR